MAQISKGDTFTNGEQVTGARLNQLVDSSTLLTGAITEQGALTAATVASDDLVLISDTSASALRKATVNDILGSSLPVTASTLTATSVVTSVVNAVANSDILITPNDGTNVTSKTFSSGDGITATVTSTAHGLVTGQNVTITASNSAYSGTYKITVTTVDAFTYVLFPVSTAASGTCSYIREGSVRINGELNVSAGLNVAGATALAGALTSSGTANFTGALQVNGTVGYALTEVVEETITTYTNASLPASWTTAWTSASYVKPAGEIWVIESCFNWQRTVGMLGCAIRLKQTSSSTDLFGLFDIEGAGSIYIHHEQAVFKYVVADATTFTSTFTMDAIASSAGYSFELGCTTFGTGGVFTGVTIPSSKFRIYKYKTA